MFTDMLLNEDLSIGGKKIGPDGNPTDDQTQTPPTDKPNGDTTPPDQDNTDPTGTPDVS